MANDHGAFVPGVTVELGPTGSGALDGVTFVVKDNIDVAGVVTGAGNPDWRAGHPPAVGSAPCVTVLLAAGGQLTGKTVSDELAFSLEGRNAFDGTPVNPACPDGLPGGSSSGSAVAVAAGLADFALGTDTGGSVRVPASFCGIFGFRPTHGRVSLDGVVPLAPSYDTVGWFARSAAVLRRVGTVLLGHADPPPVTCFMLATDAFAMLDPGDRTALLKAAQVFGPLGTGILFDGAPALWRECYRVVQGGEIWRLYGDWITRTKPRFAPDIAARFADAAGIADSEIASMTAVRTTIADHVRGLVPPGTVLLLPTAPGPALRRDAPGPEIGAFYATALALTSAAGHAGLPQVNLPAARSSQGFPLGLSAIGWPNGDTALLRLAEEWEASGTGAAAIPIR